MTSVGTQAKARRWRFAAVCFEHPHIIHYIRQAHAHPQVDVVGVWGETREWIDRRRRAFDLPDDPIYDEWETLLDDAKPDIVALAPAHADHRLWVERMMARGVHVILSKPFATSLADADAMIAATEAAGRRLAIDWPLRWYPPHMTARRLVAEGAIGQLLQVHYHDGNRGPGRDDSDEPINDPSRLRDSFFYRSDRGGGSLIDYLGYGSTLATWFFDGAKPIEVQCTTWTPPGFEVDHHSITTVRYSTGLSRFETRWGLLSDPWIHQPLPRCGFILVGETGSLASYDHEPHVILQTREHPEGIRIATDRARAPFENALQYFVHCLDEDQPIEGPLSPAMSRVGQQIVDTAIAGAREKRTLKLLE